MRCQASFWGGPTDRGETSGHQVDLGETPRLAVTANVGVLGAVNGPALVRVVANDTLHGDALRRVVCHRETRRNRVSRREGPRSVTVK